VVVARSYGTLVALFFGADAALVTSSPSTVRQCAGAGGVRGSAQHRPAAWVTAAVISRGCGLTAAPATRTVGVASTPAATARAVT
jgi:hypothetical protein